MEAKILCNFIWSYIHWKLITQYMCTELCCIHMDSGDMELGIEVVVWNDEIARIVL